MSERQTMNSYDPSRLNSYNPNPSQASSYNPNPSQASSYNPNPSQANSYNPNPAQANSYNPNPAQASSYNPNPAQMNGCGSSQMEDAYSAASQVNSFNSSRLNKDFGGDAGYAGQAVYEQPAAETEQPNGAKAALFIIAFIGGIIGMVIASQTKPVLCVSIFGAILAVFGMAAIADSKKKYPEDKLAAWSFTLGGLIVFALPIVLGRIKNSGITEQQYNRYFGAVIGGAFALIGLVVIILPALGKSMKKRRCTYPVEATCVGINSRRASGSHHGHHHNRRVYAPIWEYFFDGRIVKSAETTYSNVNVPQVGQTCELMVNPNDAEDFYRNNGAAAAITVVVGLIFAVIGVIAALASLGFFGK